MIKILLIEDDIGIIRPLALYIEKEGYELKTCDNGGDANEIFNTYKPNLIILDINLPKKSGIEVCEEIRKNSTVPIIVLSARNSEQDKLQLFNLGVDDYVSKPFSSRELMARVSAIIKRSQTTQKKTKSTRALEFGPLTLYPKQYGATCDGKELILTKTEFAILEHCIKNAHNVITREAIMQDVMGYDNYVYDRTIDTHIKNIRKKLGDKINIETIRGIGYRFQENI